MDMRVLESNSTEKDALLFIAEKVAQTSCKWLKEKVGASVFTLDCESDDIFGDFDEVCSLWSYSETARSTAAKLNVISGVQCDSDDTTKEQCNKWICRHHLQENDSIKMANLSPTTCA